MPNDLHDVANALDKAGSKDIVKAIEVAAESYALETLDLTRRLMRTRLTPRTGRLIGSLRHTVKRSGGPITATVSSGGPAPGGTVTYAPIHEFGGTITGKPMLRIPLPPALTGAGVDRNAGISIRNDTNFRLQPRKAGPPLIVHVPSDRPWYVLAPRVKIPPRPTIGPASRFKQRQLIKDLEGIVEIVGIVGKV